ncbi:TetR family transcriptional regulator [candidate division KSB3 bacterium]|uniref:TetR family transcriptional regulator n=1 Tax=candidate division KSB3 bacterium TaxID=2044937 RepID=A0A9D5Q6Y5_9BACT|nr:TetR family transcriptional regulator [candidate division KSB3 bacterium]MBD3325858.1 TetR family transcriptional regulator [candidate division KSB3 bacterium]
MARIVKNAAERRAEIIAAAKELFQTQEYDKVTMQELMERLHIAKGTIYHYFSSKEDLLESVVEDIIDEELRKKEAFMASYKGRKMNAMHKLQLLITSGRVAEDHEHILDMLHHPSNIRMHARQLGRFLTKLAPMYAEIIAEGCEQGVFTTEHPLECAEFMLAGAQFLTDVGFYPWSDEQLTRRMAALPALLESLLHAPDGSFDFLAE